ncbi:MAG: hypothetical protein ACK45J_08855, partial [Acidimicrobiaceae bacterium]
VFKDDLYAVVLLMVLVTTVVTPPLLRWRIQRNDISADNEPVLNVTDEPVGGWIRVINNEVQLHGVPPAELILPLALESAIHAGNAQPNAALLDWMHAQRNMPLSWNEHSTELLLDLLARGNGRSWRFLDVTNVLDRALPEVAHALHARRGDATELDPTHLAQTPVVEALRKSTSRLAPSDASLILAAFISDFSDAGDATPVLDRLTLDDSVRNETRALLSASALLHAACTTEPYEPNNRVLAQLAGFLETPLMVERCRMLTEARGNLQDWQFSVLIDITTSVQGLLAHPELIEGAENSLVEVRRRDAIALTTDPLVIERLRHAAAVYLLAHEPEVLVRHA